MQFDHVQGQFQATVLQTVLWRVSLICCTLVHFNVVLTVLYIDHISQGVCKTVRTTFWCIIVLQSWGEGHEKAHNYGTDSGQIFRTFSPQLENNDTLKCSSDSFAHTLRYVVNVENCQNYIEMYQCPPIAVRRS